MIAGTLQRPFGITFCKPRYFLWNYIASEVILKAYLGLKGVIFTKPMKTYEAIVCQRLLNQQSNTELVCSVACELITNIRMYIGTVFVWLQLQKREPKVNAVRRKVCFLELLWKRRRFISLPEIFPPAPTNCPWVSEDELMTTMWLRWRQAGFMYLLNIDVRALWIRKKWLYTLF